MSQTVNPSSESSNPKIRIAALISGGGTTVMNLADKIDEGTLDAEIVQVISSRPNVKGLERAEARNIPTTVLERKKYNSPEDFSAAVWPLVRQSRAELICLAGWMNLLVIPDDFANKILNIHPGLLPSFGGKGMFGHHVHESVINHGCKISGCTVHIVDEELDHGPILVQRCVPVVHDDSAESLSARILEQEHLAYPEALRLMCTGRVVLEGRRATILPEPGEAS